MNQCKNCEFKNDFNSCYKTECIHKSEYTKELEKRLFLCMDFICKSADSARKLESAFFKNIEKE